MFALKWQGGETPATTAVHFDSFPDIVRPQANALLRRLRDDAPWVAGPLSYAASVPRGFDPTTFQHLMRGDGPTAFSRAGWLEGLSVLGRKHPGIPCILWDTLAIMGLRPSPHVEEEIPNLGPLLVHDWGISDAALHAAAKATALWGDLCYELALHSGCYAEHGCGCSHIVRELPSGATFPPMPEDRHEHATREFWEHFLSELALIYVMGFPFSLDEHYRERYARTLVAA